MNILCPDEAKKIMSLFIKMVKKIENVIKYSLFLKCQILWFKEFFFEK